MEQTTTAPIMGIVAAVFMFISGYVYLSWRQKKLEEAGIGFTEPTNVTSGDKSKADEELPSPLLSILPLISVIVTLNVLKWDIIAALLSGIILSMVLNYKLMKGFPDLLLKTGIYDCNKYQC